MTLAIVEVVASAKVTVDVAVMVLPEADVMLGTVVASEIEVMPVSAKVLSSPHSTAMPMA